MSDMLIFRGSPQKPAVRRLCFNRRGRAPSGYNKTLQQEVHGPAWTDCSKRNTKKKNKAKTNTNNKHGWMVKARKKQMGGRKYGDRAA